MTSYNAVILWTFVGTRNLSDSKLYCHKSLSYSSWPCEAKLKKEFIETLSKELPAKITSELKPNESDWGLGGDLLRFWVGTGTHDGVLLGPDWEA